MKRIIQVYVPMGGVSVTKTNLEKLVLAIASSYYGEGNESLPVPFRVLNIIDPEDSLCVNVFLESTTAFFSEKLNRCVVEWYQEVVGCSFTGTQEINFISKIQLLYIEPYGDDYRLNYDLVYRGS